MNSKIKILVATKKAQKKLDIENIFYNLKK